MWDASIRRLVILGPSPPQMQMRILPAPPPASQHSCSSRRRWLRGPRRAARHKRSAMGREASLSGVRLRTPSAR